MEKNDEQLTAFRLTFEGKFQYFQFIINIFRVTIADIPVASVIFCEKKYYMRLVWGSKYLIVR